MSAYTLILSRTTPLEINSQRELARSISAVLSRLHVLHETEWRRRHIGGRRSKVWMIQQSSQLSTVFSVKLRRGVYEIFMHHSGLSEDQVSIFVWGTGTNPFGGLAELKK
ncbi:MAG TPA: hypothetical protein VK525_01495 [Candidatus Saccharimonadales bacterium]|nr:hypothetical protein [Candidatus Saccharimonadales bacterium]